MKPTKNGKILDKVKDLFNIKKSIENNNNYNEKGEDTMAINNNQRIRPTNWGTSYYSSANSNLSVSMDIWNNMLLLRFKNRISQDNTEEATCYLSGQNLTAIDSAVRYVAKMRQEEYIATGKHTAKIEIPFKISKYDSQNKKYIPVGTLHLKSIDDKVALEYVTGEQRFEVVLYSDRVAVELCADITDEQLIKSIDLRDTAFINFSAELTNKITMMLPFYDLLVTFFEHYIGPKLRQGSNNGSSENSYRSTNNDAFNDSDFTNVSDFS